MTIDDSFRGENISRALSYTHEDKAPTATCPKDGDPLVMTLEFRGAEFICMKCRNLYGWLAPVPAESTPELQVRLEEVTALYDAERKARSHDS